MFANLAYLLTVQYYREGCIGDGVVINICRRIHHVDSCRVWGGLSTTVHHVLIRASQDRFRWFADFTSKHCSLLLLGQWWLLLLMFWSDRITYRLSIHSHCWSFIRQIIRWWSLLLIYYSLKFIRWLLFVHKYCLELFFIWIVPSLIILHQNYAVLCSMARSEHLRLACTVLDKFLETIQTLIILHSRFRRR